MGCVQPYATSPLGHLKYTRLFGFPMLHIWMDVPIQHVEQYAPRRLRVRLYLSKSYGGPTTALRKALVWCAGLAGGFPLCYKFHKDADSRAEFLKYEADKKAETAASLYEKYLEFCRQHNIQPEQPKWRRHGFWRARYVPRWPCRS